MDIPQPMLRKKQAIEVHHEKSHIKTITISYSPLSQYRTPLATTYYAGATE